VNYSLVDTRSHQQVRGGTVTAAAGRSICPAGSRLRKRCSGHGTATRAPEEKTSSRLPEHDPKRPLMTITSKGVAICRITLCREKVESAVTLFPARTREGPYLRGGHRGFWAKLTGENINRATTWRGAKSSHPNLRKGNQAGPPVSCGPMPVWRRRIWPRGSTQRPPINFGARSNSSPRGDDAYGGLAAAYEHLGQPADAEQSFKQAIALRPGYWATYNWLGPFLHGSCTLRGKRSASFSQVVLLAPDSFTGYYNLGRSSYHARQVCGPQFPLLEKIV